MKVYPKNLKNLLQEDSVSGIQQFPESIQTAISDYQKAHKQVHGAPKLTRDEIAMMLMSYGLQKLKSATEKLNNKSK